MEWGGGGEGRAERRESHRLNGGNMGDWGEVGRGGGVQKRLTERGTRVWSQRDREGESERDREGESERDREGESESDTGG